MVSVVVTVGNSIKELFPATKAWRFVKTDMVSGRKLKLLPVNTSFVSVFKSETRGERTTSDAALKVLSMQRRDTRFGLFGLGLRLLDLVSHRRSP